MASILQTVPIIVQAVHHHVLYVSVVPHALFVKLHLLIIFRMASAMTHAQLADMQLPILLEIIYVLIVHLHVLSVQAILLPALNAIQVTIYIIMFALRPVLQPILLMILLINVYYVISIVLT
jgi:hypothetical protein